MLPLRRTPTFMLSTGLTAGKTRESSSMVHGSKSKSSQLGKTILLMDGWYGFQDPAYIAFLGKRRTRASFMPPFTGLL